MWCNSFDRQNSTLQSLAPYASKLRSTTVQALIDLYSNPGDTVLDPFAGSGAVPFTAACADRCAWATELNPYAYAITRGKLEAPRSERVALQQAAQLLDAVEQQASMIDLETVPAWVSELFHPDTLQETLAAFTLLQQSPNYFLLACLLGILHHVLPGYLSYPTNPNAPYLRCVTYSPDRYPHLYTYRDGRSRLLAKLRRAYRRHRLPGTWEQRRYRVWQGNCAELPIADASVDAIISSPPHQNAFDYIRAHRLRLWFLGYSDWKNLDAALISSRSRYLAQMPVCLQEMARVLKPNGYCVLVVQDVARNGKTQGAAEQLAEFATSLTGSPFSVETVYDQPLTSERRSSKRPQAIQLERILVLRRR
nr:class I SAM-dependent methyltransferase [Leptolyngbya sp. FACHB-36]